VLSATHNGAKLKRALRDTYIEPADIRKQVAERLGLLVNTYHYQLTVEIGR
jgi:hypothetical protein